MNRCLWPGLIRGHCWGPESLRAGIGGGPGLRKQRPNWQSSHSPLGLRMCAFLKLRNSDERSPAWISCWKSFFTFFKEGKQKISVSALKMSERKENPQSSVKHRKSYYEWTLSVWCLSRKGREKMIPCSFFFLSASNGAKGEKQEQEDKWSFERQVLTFSPVCPKNFSPPLWPWKRSAFIPTPRKALPKNIQTTAQLHPSHTLAKWKLISCVQLFATSWTTQSMEFFRPEYRSG